MGPQPVPQFWPLFEINRFQSIQIIGSKITEYFQDSFSQGIVKPHKEGDCRSETVRLFLEQEFMKRLMAIEDAPEDVKFPVGAKFG